MISIQNMWTPHQASSILGFRMWLSIDRLPIPRSVAKSRKYWHNGRSSLDSLAIKLKSSVHRTTKPLESVVSSPQMRGQTTRNRSYVCMKRSSHIKNRKKIRTISEMKHQSGSPSWWFPRIDLFRIQKALRLPPAYSGPRCFPTKYPSRPW